MERNNSGFSRNNPGFGSKEDISERITFKAPKTPSPVSFDNLESPIKRHTFPSLSFIAMSRVFAQIPEPLLESKEPLLDQQSTDQLRVGIEKEQEGASNNGDEGETYPKHPLMHAWTLWHYKNDPRLQWDANLVKVHTFRSVRFI